MGAHVGSAAVQARGCGVLWGLANGSDELRVAIVAAGGIAAVVRALG
eukprot:COSAG03_NODE_32677_length_139_cov_34.500000_1_plen_46_part_11